MPSRSPYLRMAYMPTSTLGTCLNGVFARNEPHVDAGRVVSPRHEGHVAGLVVEWEEADVHLTHARRHDRSKPRDRSVTRQDDVTVKRADEVFVDTVVSLNCRMMLE